MFYFTEAKGEDSYSDGIKSEQNLEKKNMGGRDQQFKPDCLSKWGDSNLTKAKIKLEPKQIGWIGNKCDHL